MPLTNLPNVIDEDVLDTGRQTINSNFDVLRIFSNSLETALLNLTPEQVGNLIVAGKINPTYLEALLTSISAAEVPVLDAEGNFIGEDVEAVLAELYDALDNIVFPVGGSPYIADDGRVVGTVGFTPPAVAATALGSVAIGSSIQVLGTSADNTVFGRDHEVSETSDSTVGGVGLAPYLVYGSSMFGTFSSIENVDTSFYWGTGGYFGATIPGQSSYSDVVMGDGVYAFDAYESIAIGAGATVDTVDNSMAVGPFAEVLTSDGAAALGANSSINTANNAIAIGFQAGVNTAEGAISMGWGAIVDQGSTSSIGIVPGYGLVRNSTDAVAVGRVVSLQNSNSGTSIGSYTHVENSANGIVLGTLSEVQTSVSGIAIGNTAFVSNSLNGIAIGTESSVVNSNYSLVLSADGGFSSVTGTVGSPNNRVLNTILGGESSSILTSNYSTLIGNASGDIENAYLGVIISSEGSTILNSNGYAGVFGGVWNTIEDVGSNNYIFASNSSEISNLSDQSVILGGFGNNISGDAWYRTILGGEFNVIDRDNVEFLGISPAAYYTYARRDMEFVLSGYRSAVADTNRSGTPNAINTGGKASNMQMLVRTTDDTPTYLKLSNADHVPLLDRTVTGFKVYLVATNFDEVADESAYWEITFATDVREGVGRLLGTPIINEIHKDVPGWDVSIDVETITPTPVDPLANFANARIQVTGEAAKNITWTARVDISELDF